MGRGVRLPVIADETALLIDAELARLRLETPELFRVLYLSHVEGLSFRAIGQEMGFSHSTARNRLRQATALARPVENQMSGTVAQQFEIKGKRRHGLYGLYEAIPDDLRKKLDLDNHASTFEEKDSVFTVQRYEYEPGAKGTFDDALLHLAAELIPKLVDHFLELGASDPWLQFYKANPQHFKLPTGIDVFGIYRHGVD